MRTMRQMMRVVVSLCLCFAMFVGIAGTASAKKEMRPAGVVASDFACHRVALGDIVDEAMLTNAFGAPLFDTEKSIFGIHVKAYTMRKNIVVTVDTRDNRVVDIVITDRDYKGRNGVRYGATPSHIRLTYGATERQMIEGEIWYIYQNPDAPRQRLMLKAESPHYSLVSWRITSLPLTEEEADEREDEDWESNQLDGMLLKDREIDMSAIEARDRTEVERQKRQRTW